MSRLAIQVLLGVQVLYLTLATLELLLAHKEVLFSHITPTFWYILFVGLIAEAICDEITKNRKK